MVTRRTFLSMLGTGITAAPSLAWSLPAIAADSAAAPKKKLAIVTTVWRYRSHAWHMGERFLVGYPRKGRWHQPPFEVVSAYVDQTGANDLSRQRAQEFGFGLYPSVAEALRCGGKQLAVDAVLIIGEHGDYPRNELGQVQYPRYEFFSQVADVFRKDGRTAPVFNDKHLSWNWDYAAKMVRTSQELKIPFLAGSSLPVTWRMPAVDLPYEAEVEECLCLAYGGVDSYDFHALEVIQCMAERRKGGETGVAAVQALQGDAVWKALEAGNWQAGGWDSRLFDACLARTQTLAQPETFSHRRPTVQQMRDWVKQPTCYRIEYADGCRATMLLMNGLVQDFTFAAKLKNQSEPLSTLFYLPPNPNVTYSAALMSQAEELFITGNPPYPVERTLLTSGVLAAALQSLAKQQRLETPHLGVRYQAPEKSLFVNE